MSEQENIAGALFDFAGFLVTRQKVVMAGSTVNASPMTDALKEFLELRGLADVEPDKSRWEEIVGACLCCNRNYEPLPESVAGTMEAFDEAFKLARRYGVQVRLGDSEVSFRSITFRTKR